MVSALIYLVLKLYEQREEQTDTAVDVFKDLSFDTTAKSVTRALEKPSYGDIGSFVGYDDWTLTKQSGLGGGVQMYEPLDIRLMRSGQYSSEERPSINQIL